MRFSYKKLFIYIVFFSISEIVPSYQPPKQQKPQKVPWYDCLLAPFRRAPKPAKTKEVKRNAHNLEDPFLEVSLTNMPVSEGERSDQELSRNSLDPFAVSANSTPGVSSSDDSLRSTPIQKISLQEIRRIIKSLKYPSFTSVFKSQVAVNDSWDRRKETLEQYRTRRWNEDQVRTRRVAEQRQADVKKCFVVNKDAMKKLLEAIIAYRSVQLNSPELLFATLGYWLADVTSDLAFEELTHDASTIKFETLEKQLQALQTKYGKQLDQSNIPLLQNYAKDLLRAYDQRIQREERLGQEEAQRLQDQQDYDEL